MRTEEQDEAAVLPQPLRAVGGGAHGAFDLGHACSTSGTLWGRVSRSPSRQDALRKTDCQSVFPRAPSEDAALQRTDERMPRRFHRRSLKTRP